MRPLNRSAKAAGATLLLVVLFSVWYSIAANYDYDALAGTYTFNGDGVSSTLVLKADATYQQEVHHDGRVDRAQGTWHRSGIAGTDFSIGFLNIPGAKTYAEEFPDHLEGDAADYQYSGRFERTLGIYPALRMNANPPGPTFHKKLFR